MFEYDELSREAVRVLDNDDFGHLIDICRDLKIKNVYAVKDFFEYTNSFDDNIAIALNNLSPDEFMEYLTARYNVKWTEIISYEMQ